MEPQAVPYIEAHLHLFRADSLSDAAAWASTDPFAACGGYGKQSVHEWGMAEAAELRVPRGGGTAFLVHCLDHDGASELRTETRPRHLDWLKASGRVHLAGPLREGGGQPVGTLLLVSGDSAEEVRAWAGEDPYAAAGLFSEVRVSPAPETAIPETAAGEGGTAPLVAW